jgi:hypothetical protein
MGSFAALNIIEVTVNFFPRIFGVILKQVP